MPIYSTRIQPLLARVLKQSVILKMPMYGYGTKKLDYKLINRPLSHELKDVIKKLSQEPSIKHVLDLGCGDGVIESHSHNRAYSYTAIDVEEAAINTLQKTFKQQAITDEDTAIVGDVTRLSSITELHNKQFDAAILWRVLHGISPHHHQQIFQDIYNLLAPASSFYIAVASDQDWKAVALNSKKNQGAMRDCADIMFRQYGIKRDTPFNVHFFTLDELKKLGVAVGFTVSETSIFQESSGYNHLKGQKNTYLFVHFTKN